MTDEEQREKSDESAAEPHIECSDVWPPNKLSMESLEAYKLVEKRGLIKIQRVMLNSHTAVSTIVYLSTCPHQWILKDLKAARNQIIEAKTAGEQQKI